MRNSAARMRRDWEDRAASDPLIHIDATQRDITLAEFYETGNRIVEQVVDPVLSRFGVDPAGKTVLEIGCGMGRLFPGLAQRFGTVIGIDIASTMVIRGRKHCPVPATWLVGDGFTLTGVEDDAVDHLVSFEVFQHVLEPDTVVSYLQDARRVLHPGGTFQFQLRCGSDSQAQEAFRSVPRALRVTSARALRALGLLPVVGDIDTWLGCIIDPGDAVAMARRLGFTDVCALPDEFHEAGMGYWLIGRTAESPEVTNRPGR